MTDTLNLTHDLPTGSSVDKSILKAYVERVTGVVAGQAVLLIQEAADQVSVSISVNDRGIGAVSLSVDGINTRIIVMCDVKDGSKRNPVYKLTVSIADVWDRRNGNFSPLVKSGSLNWEKFGKELRGVISDTKKRRLVQATKDKFKGDLAELTARIQAEAKCDYTFDYFNKIRITEDPAAELPFEIAVTIGNKVVRFDGQLSVDMCMKIVHKLDAMRDELTTFIEDV